jgi:subtilisin family serine protease
MKSRIVLLSVALSGIFLSAFATLPTVKSNPFRLPAGITQTDMVPGTIIFKLKPEYRAAARVDGVALQQLNSSLSLIGAQSVNKVFPGKMPPSTERNAQGLKMVDLSLIYEVTYASGMQIEKAVNAILSTGLVEFAEPKYLPRLFFTPNDPQIGQQYHLGKVQAFAGWDISQGDTNVVIGITDTGTDIDHPDLEPNLKFNYNDPVNGIDDDGDGYTDNWRGWDLGENDNNPSVNASNHGSHVSGCAVGTTNNGTGGAAPGFNCKYLPVKISNASGSLTKAYEGIVYAADMGCDIINCSWGGPGGGAFGQNIIDYATINQNALVIAAAGNDNNENAFYPASYRYVISVASTGTTDARSSFSNYGANIDVCAPGSNIYAAQSNNTYFTQSGTSMASPVAAGVAGIIKSHFPSYTALQVGEQLRVTCDNIYAVNGAFLNKLGTGRVNMFRALTENGPSVRMSNLVMTDNNDNAFVAGDTIRVSGDITNYLAPTSNLDITITSTSTWINIIDNNTFVGVLGTLASTDNNADPFQIVVNPGAPLNHKAIIKINIADGNYTDFQIFELLVNVDYINVTINQVATSITSKGRICYNGTGQTEGLGFVYNGENLVYEAGLMIGQSSTKVSDNVRGSGANTDNDFQSLQVVQRLIPSVQSEFDLFGKFRDNIATTPIPVTVSHKAFAWSTPGDDKYVMVEYSIKNTGTTTLNNVWAGIFADWDIQDYNLNKGGENASLKMGYVYNTTPTGLWAGIKVLTPTPFNHYAIDNIAGLGGVNMTDGYDTNEKYTTLSTARATAGGTGTGNDVIDVVSTGPFTLTAGDSVTVAFALIAGDDLDDINTSAGNAQIKYDNLTSVETPVAADQQISVYPNPAGNSVTLVNIRGQRIELTDVTGRTVMTVEKSFDNSITLNIESLSSGTYLIKSSSNNSQVVTKFVKQ